MSGHQVGSLVYHICLAWLSLTLIYFEANAESERIRTTYGKIYEKINGASACFRRFNGTHQIGCSSKSLNGDNGVLHIVQDTESLNWVIKDGPHSPYIVIMHPKDFIPEKMKKFQATDRVSGVLLTEAIIQNETVSLDHFSTELSCPNKGFGMYSKSSEKYCPRWNFDGNGLLYEDWDFPVFYIHASSDAQFILNCYEDFNKPTNGVAKQWPLCAAQLQSFMLGAVDTPTCIRRSKIFSITPGSSKVCDPLGDFSIYAPIASINQSTPYSNKSVIVIGAHLDASSMFDKVAPGADSAATGIATILAVLKQLSIDKEKLATSKVENIYVVLFQGEAFDYIGSSRIVYDMARGQFPYEINVNSSIDPAILKLENIKYFIEIGQVALNSSQDSYYIHQNWDASQSSLDDTRRLKQELSIFGTEFGLKFSSVPQNEMGLPPSSFQSFLKVSPDVPGIVITNFESKFKNPFYNSVFDTDKNLGYSYNDSSQDSIQNKLSSLAATIVKTVWKIAEVTPAETIEADFETVDELLYCYVKSARCNIFQRVYTLAEKLEDVPFPLYVGVQSRGPSNPVTLLTRSVMVYFHGNNVSKTESDCKDDPSNPQFGYNWINGTCFESTVNISEAVSPAFLIENYDWKNGNYSTWTESIWQKLQVRVFLKPSLSHELLTLCFGIAVFLVSFVVVGFANRKSDVIFSSSSSADAIIC